MKFPPAVAEVLRLLDSGVSADVVQTYIRNSPGRYFLTTDQLVALHDRGVPPEITVAMLTRTAELRARAARPPLAPQIALGAVPAAPIDRVPAGYAGAAVQPPVYGVGATYPVAPYSYDNFYPAFYPSYYYPYSIYPYSNYSAWWWTPGWGHYGYGRHDPYYRGWAGNHVRARGPNRWPDAYPNRLVTGPYWGANRGFASRSGRWADAYPNRLVTGPFWGANRGSTGRSAAMPHAGASGGKAHGRG